MSVAGYSSAHIMSRTGILGVDAYNITSDGSPMFDSTFAESTCSRRTALRAAQLLATTGTTTC